MEQHERTHYPRQSRREDRAPSSTIGEGRLPFRQSDPTQQKPAADVYALVTDRIITALEANTVPWHKPWAAGGGLPRNLSSRRPYRGMNILLLSLGQPYQSPWWLTFKQAQDLGGHIRKGEKSMLVTFWKFDNDKKDTDENDKGEETAPDHRAPLLRTYHVFNLEQCDGIQAPPSNEFQPKIHERIAQCEALVAGMPQRPTIRQYLGHALYTPTLDTVFIPHLSQFETAESYYATLFHELVHSTGHSTRLARPALGTPAPFGSSDYSKEELVAEFGAAFLAAHTGIFPHVAENQTAYINGWLSVLKRDKRLLPIAAAQAQRAADFILGSSSGPGDAE